MRKIFIDAGCHHGESVDAFIKSKDYDKAFEVHCFEPDKSLYLSLLYNDDIDCLHNYAVSTYNGSVSFYHATNKEKAGGSICDSKETGCLDKDNPSRVICVDFSQWLIDTFDEEDYIILRMNIEGAEYPILTKMIMDSTIKYINKLSISFHWAKINYPQSMHNAIIKELEALITMEITREAY